VTRAILTVRVIAGDPFRLPLLGETLMVSGSGPALAHVAKQGDGFRYYLEGMAL